MALNIGTGTYRGLNRFVCNEIQKLADRVANLDPNFKRNKPAIFARNFGTGRDVVRTIDLMAQSVATADGKSPNYIFKTHWHWNRQIIVALKNLEARVTALGY